MHICGKLFTMNQKIIELQIEVDHYRFMANQCHDIIHQLTDCTPENFKMTFSINDRPIVVIPINEAEGNFCMGFFMSFHQFYAKQLKDSQAVLAAMSSRKAI